MIQPKFDWDAARTRAIQMCERFDCPQDEITKEGGLADTIASRELLVHKLGTDITPKVRDEVLKEIVELECKLAPFGLV